MEFSGIILKYHVLKHQVSNMLCNFKCGKSLKFSIKLILGLVKVLEILSIIVYIYLLQNYDV